MAMIPTPHINAPAGAFAETVLMPGDPKRSEFIATHYLTDAVLVNDVRGVRGYTGYYKDKRVSVMASGMGMPSIGIYSYELYNFYGVESIIRVGSAGKISPKLKIGDVVAAMSAYTTSTYAAQYGFTGSAAPCADYGLLEKAVAAARAMGIRLAPGAVFSSDAFYAEAEIGKILTKLGVLAVEMECAALYLNAALAGKRALALLTISDDAATGEGMTAEQRATSLTEMIQLALETA